MRFPRSKLYVSVIPIARPRASSIGFAGALLGIGGGFIMVPALLYLFRVPTARRHRHLAVPDPVHDASSATILHAVANQAVDIVLALLLIVGGVFGAQFGARAGPAICAPSCSASCSRCCVLAVGLRFAVELVVAARRAVLDRPSEGRAQ